MDSTKCVVIHVLLIFQILAVPSCISSLDTITLNQPIKDGDILLSSKKIFALGFFRPGISPNRYVGVWYNKVPEKTVVWVANRDNPITGTGQVLAVNGEHGGLVIYCKDQNTPIWSANVTISSPNSSVTAKLLDTGNLLVLENNGSSSERLLWQGFDYPTNTMLPFMKLGLNRRSGKFRFLTSWKSKDDPGTGSCSYRIDPGGFPQMFIYKGQTPLWRAGTWTGERWAGLPQMTNDFVFNASFVNNEDELSDMFGVKDESIYFARMMIDESGTIEGSMWQDQARRWDKFWSAPVELCDFYGKCGPNSNCDPTNADEFECKCLPGFEPKSQNEWNLRDGSGGCIRRKGASVCENGEGFVKVARVKVPNASTSHVNMSTSLKECEEECLSNCSCMAYSNADDRWGGSGCVTWHGDLMDTRTYLDVNQEFYVRVDPIVLAQYVKKSSGVLSKKGKLIISLVSGVIFCLLFSLACWLAKKKQKGKQGQDKGTFSMMTTSSTTNMEGSHARTELDESSLNSDLPFFELSAIAAATNNFSSNNKLGSGGFGSVYKGVLYNGTEIAVKRLAKNSGQGIEEFKNEVTLIAKLQHRNLVRILGCCVQDEEKMLIYEYLPNKSLDFFIFADESKRAFLDWKRRFEIICGVARGILYLHQDSRLRIIHRDLKASNVLLDSAMNPKISDFGMARIFGAEQIEANTNRVVGTYGYMSPEYAMEGLFSVKSDVYSFGVLLLEIVSGRKNIGHYHDIPHSNLVGHVWNLWKEGRSLEIIDSSLGETYHENVVVRCIQIALLCVQEHATDRPTLSAVVFMLGNDAAVPSPRQPGFLLKRSYHTSEDPSASTEGPYSIYDVTCTEIQAR